MAADDERLARVDDVPVRLHDLLHEVRELRAVRELRLHRGDVADVDEQVREIRTEAPQQRLVQGEQQLRLVLRHETLEPRVRDEAIVGEVDLEVRAGAQQLLQGHVPIDVLGDVGADAGERRRVRRFLAVLVDVEDEVRIEGGLGGAHVLECPDRRQSLRGDSGIVSDNPP